MKVFLNSLGDSNAAFPLWDAPLLGFVPDANCDEKPASSRSLALNPSYTPLHHALLTRTQDPGFSSPVSALAVGNRVDQTTRSLSQTPTFHLGERDDDDDTGDVLSDLREIVARMARSHRQSPDERFAHVYLRPIENVKVELQYRLNAFQATLRTLTHSREIDEFPASEKSWNRLLSAWESWLFGDTMPRHLYLPTSARIAQVQAASFSAIFWGFTAKFLEATVAKETLGKEEWRALAKRLLNLPWLCETGFEKKFDAYFTLIKVLGTDIPTHLDLDSLATELHLDESATERLREAFFKRVPIETESDVARVTTYLNGFTDTEKRKAYQDLRANPNITAEAMLILNRYVEESLARETVNRFLTSTPTEN